MKHRNNSIATTIFYAMLINCIICWNVRGIMSSAYPLSNMLDSEKIDVALITEHKLLLRSLHFLDTINSKYKSTCSFDSDVDYFTHVRCGKAGTAILYRKDISNKATCIENIANDRISGIEIRVENCPPIFMFWIYMPAESDIENYTATLSDVQALLSFYTLKGTVILGGDFNGQLVYGNEKPSNQKSKLLSKFASNNSLHSRHHVFRSKAFTFTTTQTTIDHILVERSAIQTFKSYRVILSNDIVTSDHLPLVF